MEEPEFYSPEMEKVVLAALLSHQGAYWQITSFISNHSFYLPKHQKVFTAISSLARRFDPIDAVTVRKELIRTKELEAIGGSEFLAELAVGVPSVSDVGYPAQVLYEYELRRELIAILSISLETLRQLKADPVMELENLPSPIEQLERGHAYTVFQSMRDKRSDAIAAYMRTLDNLAGD